MVYAEDLKSSGRKTLRVRVSPAAPEQFDNIIKAVIM